MGEQMFDGKVHAALGLKVALDEEDAAKVGALLEEVVRLRAEVADLKHHMRCARTNVIAALNAAIPADRT